jgi:hypothetical protein
LIITFRIKVVINSCKSVFTLGMAGYRIPLPVCYGGLYGYTYNDAVLCCGVVGGAVEAARFAELHTPKSAFLAENGFSVRNGRTCVTPQALASTKINVL